MEGQSVVRTRSLIILAGAGGFAAGALVGFLVARNAGQKEVDRRVTEEAEAVRDHYAARPRNDDPAPEGGWPAPVGARRTLGTVVGPPLPQLQPLLPRIETSGLRIGDPGNTPGPSSPGDPDTGTEDGDAGGGDLLEGMPDDTPDVPEGWPAEEDAHPDGLLELTPEQAVNIFIPHIITRTEFFDDTETENQKITITYYDGDKVLVDEKDVPIRDSDHVVGEDFAELFGSSDDPDIVYVRNNRIRIDFEIVRDERGYAEAILGYGEPK